MSSVPEKTAQSSPNAFTGQNVGLGCGTLGLIALIVWLLSGRDAHEMRNEVGHLRSEVAELRKAVDAQMNEIKSLQKTIDRAKAKE
jgi:hypothetical protein